MHTRTYLFSIFMLMATVSFGCAEKKAEKTFSGSDVERMLQEHPELLESVPEQDGSVIE